MNRIIAIYGHSNCGKTETLNFLRELLRSKGNSMSLNPPYIGDIPETFEYKGRIICVCPGGDTEDIVRNNFDYAYSKNADVILTASRTRGGSLAVIIEEEKKNGIKVEWMQKSYEYNLCKETQRLCNMQFAEVLFRRLDV